MESIWKLRCTLFFVFCIFHEKYALLEPCFASSTLWFKASRNKCFLASLGFQDSIQPSWTQTKQPNKLSCFLPDPPQLGLDCLWSFPWIFCHLKELGVFLLCVWFFYFEKETSWWCLFQRKFVAACCTSPKPSPGLSEIYNKY